jgi:putative transposase
MDVREKKHRLPKSFYQGEVSVAFTLCTKSRKPIFMDQHIMDVFTDKLASIIKKTGCIVPVYCFMPDHQHIMITGTSSAADVWATLVSYKQKTGYWLSKNNLDFEWQKDFCDHVIKEREQVATQVRYLLDNPVRKGLARTWEEYPYKGSMGCELKDVLCGIM